MRIKFKSDEQRKFLNEVLKNLHCPSLMALNQFGLDIPYSTLKNYMNESRTLPEQLFNDLCYLAKIEKEKLKFESLPENWGKVLGGKN